VEGLSTANPFCEIALLGMLPDREVAQRLSRSPGSVTQKRIKLGLANSLDGRRRYAPEDRIVGRVLFLDGVTREVYEDSEGRQWVIGYCGERSALRKNAG
jgi:hypothetical protein